MSTRQLATLVSAGVPLVEALNALVEQTEHKALKGVFARVRDKVNEGASLADALLATGRFDNLYISMVRAGEASGDSVALGSLAHAEAAQVPASGGEHGGDAERDRVGAHREAADGGRVGRDDGVHGLGDGDDAVGSARRLLGVEEPRARGAALQGELATAHRVLEHVRTEAVEGRVESGEFAHGPEARLPA